MSEEDIDSEDEQRFDEDSESDALVAMSDDDSEAEPEVPAEPEEEVDAEGDEDEDDSDGSDDDENEASEEIAPGSIPRDHQSTFPTARLVCGLCVLGAAKFTYHLACRRRTASIHALPCLLTYTPTSRTLHPTFHPLLQILPHRAHNRAPAPRRDTLPRRLRVPLALPHRVRRRVHQGLRHLRKCEWEDAPYRSAALVLRFGGCEPESGRAEELVGE